MRLTIRCLAGALVLAVALVGCSDSKSSDSAPASPASTSLASTPGATAALLKSSADKAGTAGTVGYSMAITASTPGKPDSKVSAKGVSALKPPVQGRFEMTISGEQQATTTEMLLTSESMYMKFPEKLAKQLGGKAWVKMTFADLETGAGLNLQQLIEQSQQAGPTVYLKTLAAARDIREVGKEKIRGTATTHYSGKVSAAELKAVYPGAAEEQLDGLIEQMGQAPLEMDVWIGPDGLPRRLRQVMTAGESTNDIAIEFLEFGAKLNVTPPPAADTTDFAALSSASPAK